jgi:hypothetical protein
MLGSHGTAEKPSKENLYPIGARHDDARWDMTKGVHRASEVW